MASPLRTVLALQSAYFLATGIWPLVHRSSFEKVTGAKSDFWLARTVGGLTTLVGIVLALGARRHEPSREVRLLALGSLPVYAAADAYAGRRASRAYYGDLFVQACLAGAWLRYGRRER